MGHLEKLKIVAQQQKQSSNKGSQNEDPAVAILNIRRMNKCVKNEP